MTMDEYALVLNAGSSSLKFCVFHRADKIVWGVAARGQVDGIGTAPRFIAKDSDGNKIGDEEFRKEAVADGSAAVEILARWLRFKYGGSQVVGVGHRVVHGGSRFAGPTIITPEVLDELYKLVPLAPLHQPYNLAAIAAVSERLPDVPQVACFDTSFHSGHDPVMDVIPLPIDLTKDGLRRYGFHG